MARVYLKRGSFIKSRINSINNKATFFIAFFMLTVSALSGYIFARGATIFSLIMVSLVLFGGYKVVAKVIDKLVTERRKWIKGLDGEALVAQLLSELEGNFYVFNGLKGGTG